jgi:hypothetical protein
MVYFLNLTVFLKLFWIYFPYIRLMGSSENTELISSSEQYYASKQEITTLLSILHLKEET